MDPPAGIGEHAQDVLFGESVVGRGFESPLLLPALLPLLFDAFGGVAHVTTPWKLKIFIRIISKLALGKRQATPQTIISTVCFSRLPGKALHVCKTAYDSPGFHFDRIYNIKSKYPLQ
jgi:hypothetical protein